jgi:hypothetical protein
MTLQKIKETLVDEKNVVSKKELYNFIIKLALAFIGICLTLGIATYSILGFGFTVLVIIMTIFGFNFVFDIISEQEDSFKLFKKFSNFWWLSYILLVIVFFVLKAFRFM